ncbi:unnamed protein product, partial [Mesorhabditis spiculigera]
MSGQAPGGHTIKESEANNANGVLSQDEDHLLAPFEYIRERAGKKVRTKLAMAFNEWMQIPEQKLSQIMDIVELLHNASLMIDDIEDNSVLRRGQPCTHRIYGIARTINSANYVYFIAQQRCLALGETVAKIFTEQMLELHRGQGKEIFWRDSVVCPSESEYETMVLQKTGGLFMLAIRSMQVFSNVPEQKDFTSLLRNLAVYFQIRDDYLNLCSADMHAAKSYAEDLTEGKFSYPIIKAIKSKAAGNDDEVLNILRQRTEDIELKKFCVSLIQSRGAFDSTLARLKELAADIMENVQQLGENTQIMQLIDLLNKDLIAS